MKTLGRLIWVAVIAATPAVASTGSRDDGWSLMTILFIGFGALIVLFQSSPGISLFGGMIKGLFTLSGQKSAQSAAGGNNQGRPI